VVGARSGIGKELAVVLSQNGFAMGLLQDASIRWKNEGALSQTPIFKTRYGKRCLPSFCTGLGQIDTAIEEAAKSGQTDAALSAIEGQRSPYGSRWRSGNGRRPPAALQVGRAL
jgi:hypothetical protein